MCGTTYSSLQSSKTLNYRRIITHRASVSAYCSLPLSAVYGLSRLTKLTTSKGAGTADSNSNRISKLRRSLWWSWEIKEFVFNAKETAVPVPHQGVCCLARRVALTSKCVEAWCHAMGVSTCSLRAQCTSSVHLTYAVLVCICRKVKL